MRPVLTSLIAFMLAAPALAEESVVTLGEGVVGTLNLPEGGSGAAVLMLHGFGSSRDEVGGMYADAAAALAEAGIASLRIDFRGFGQSGGDTGDHTVARQNADAAAGLIALQQAAGVDPSRIGVLGFSFGGGAAVELAAAHPDAVASLVTWSAVGDYDVDFLQSLGQAAFDRAAADGIVGLDLGFRTIALKQAFFDSLAGPDIAAAIAAYPGPYLTVVGSEDYYAQYAAPMAAAAGGDDAAALVIEGGDHIFHVFDPAAGFAGEVISATVARFSATL